MSEIAHRAADPRAKIGDTRPLADERAARERIGRGQSAIMILVMREKLFRTQPVEMAAHRPQLRQDDGAGDGMAFVEPDCPCRCIGHGCSPERAFRGSCIPAATQELHRGRDPRISNRYARSAIKTSAATSPVRSENDPGTPDLCR